MIPVRRWPLFAALLLTLTADRWMPFARWALIVPGVLDVAGGVWLGWWWMVAAVCVVLPASVWCTFVAQRSSRELGRELRAMRDADRAAGIGGVS